VKALLAHGADASTNDHVSSSSVVVSVPLTPGIDIYATLKGIAACSCHELVMLTPHNNTALSLLYFVSSSSSCSCCFFFFFFLFLRVFFCLSCQVRALVQGYSPLLLAVLQGDISKVKQLLSEAADQADLMRMLNDQVRRCFISLV